MSSTAAREPPRPLGRVRSTAVIAGWVRTGRRAVDKDLPSACSRNTGGTLHRPGCSIRTDLERLRTDEGIDAVRRSPSASSSRRVLATVIAPYVRLGMSSDHPAAALIAAIVISTLTPLRRHRHCASSALADVVGACSASAGSFSGRRVDLQLARHDAVAAHDPSRAYPANSGSCSDRTVCAADQPSSDLAFWTGLSGICPANLTVTRPHGRRATVR